MRLFKCIVLGSKLAGKTTLLSSYINERFCEDVKADTNYEFYSMKVKSPNDIFILCFSVADAEQSFHAIPNRWISYIRMCCPYASIILVATKTDLRDDNAYLQKWKITPITYEQGEQIALEIGAIEYRECSALEEIGVSEVFETVASICVQNLMNAEKVIKRENINGEEYEKRNICCFM
ncbi:uncharacterized protein LOC142234372 [Haematobia irritans]|uniref:uncharacterized protein LOC142234372 n=1 Tax=Haematobia irritans TaxID=7368 RepID=UPI003F4FFA7D